MLQRLEDGGDKVYCLVLAVCEDTMYISELQPAPDCESAAASGSRDSAMVATVSLFINWKMSSHL